MFTRILVFLLAFSPSLLMAQGTQSFITVIINNAGFAGWATIGMSVIGFFLVFKLFLDTRREKIIPGGLVEEVEGALEDEEYEAAFEAVEGDPSFLGKVLEGGLSKLNYGYEAVEKGADEAWVNEQTALLQIASYVQLCGQLAPMMGLFGTVFGMMKAFAVLAQSAGAANPKDLATGIMNALVTTFIGLLVAIPCNIAYLIIRNKVVASGLEAGTIANNALARLREEEE